MNLVVTNNSFFDNMTYIFIGGIIFLVFLLLAVVGVWVNKDAKEKGLNNRLWVLIVLLIPNLMGLILYFLVGRKEANMICKNCNSRVRQDAKYCDNCGTILEVEESQDNRSKKGAKRFLITIIAIISLMFMLVIGFVVINVVGDNFTFQSGYSIASFETNFGSQWTVKFKKATLKYTDTIQIKDSSPEKLYINASCGKGDLFLNLIQGDKKEIIDLTKVGSDYQYDLSTFENGKVRMQIVNDKAEDVRVKIHWK